MTKYGYYNDCLVSPYPGRYKFYNTYMKLGTKIATVQNQNVAKVATVRIGNRQD
jgi:hypothetical protein